MKKKVWKVLPLATLLAAGTVMPAHAEDFWDSVTANVSTTGTVSTADALINGANVSGSWNDTNTNGQLDVGESLKFLNIKDRSGAVVLSAPASALTDRGQLEAWAEANAEAILTALFPSGISEITGASEDNIMASATVERNLFNKVVVKRQGAERLNSDIGGQLEYLDLDVNDKQGSAVGMTVNYANEGDSGLAFTMTMPYRYTSMKDDINSKSHLLGLDLALKYPVVKWEKGDWKLGGAIFGSAFFLKTDTIDKSGDLKYGGGMFTSVSQNLGFGTLSGGVDYRIAKAYLPSSMNSDNVFVQKAVDYVNDLDPVHTVSYGVNLGIPLAGDKAAVNLEVVRFNYISDDIPDGQKDKTTVGLSGSYFPTDTFELNLGVKSDFELDNVDTLGVMLGVVHKF